MKKQRLHVFLAGMVAAWGFTTLHAQTPLTHTFIYQGRLTEGGAGVTGDADILFRLYDAEGGGGLIDNTGVSSIPVVDGLFTAQVTFVSGAFNGDQRWLELEVEFPSGLGNWTTLTPRQPLTATPYALYAVTSGDATPWQQSGGDVYIDAGEVGIGTTAPAAPLHVVGSGSRAARFRNTAPAGGVAVAAEATGGPGFSAAFDAYAASPGGYGVYAFNEAESGNAHALFGETSSPDGIAIRGEASNDDEYSTGIGVHGKTRADFGGAGVYGESTTPVGGSSIGVRGTAVGGIGVRGDHSDTGNRGELGTDDEGVRGEGQGSGAGVRGVAGGTGPGGEFLIADSANPAAALQAHTPNPAGYAGHFTGGRSYFEGDVGIGTTNPVEALHVAGNLRLGGGNSVSFGGSATRLFESSGDLYLDADDDIYLAPDDDIRMDGSTLFVDGGLNRVGVGTTSPDESLDVRGNVQVSGDYVYAADRTVNVHVPALAFRNAHPGVAAAYGANDAYGYIEIDPVAPFEVYPKAIVRLPHGATIEELIVYYRDNTSGGDVAVSARLTQFVVATGAGGNLGTASGSSSGVSASMQSASLAIAAAPTVDNNAYYYVLNLAWEQTALVPLLRFHGCTVVCTTRQLSP